MSRTPDQVLEAMARRAGVDPVRLHILIADRCNHACGHCYQVHGLKGEMPFLDVLTVIENFRASGGMVLSVSGGEATLRPDLIEILSRARDIGLATILYTNGYLIDEALADRIAACGVWRVDVSVYSDVPNEHDALTRVEGSWSRTTEAIRLLVQRGVRVLVKTTLTTAAHQTSFERMGALAQRLGCAWVVAEQVSSREDGDLEPVAQRLAPDRAVAFMDAGIDASCAVEHDDDVPAHDRAPCGVGSGALAVRSDGSLVPCTNIPIEISRSAVDVHLGDTLRNSEVVAFFRSLTWNSLHGCRDCDLMPTCGRCHATALGETGDLLGPYPGGCSLAVARHALRSGNRSILEPGPDCSESRDKRIGPFHVEPDATLRPIRDVVNAGDLALVRRFPWIRATRPELREMASGTRSRLVRLRRNAGDYHLDSREATK